MDNNKRQPISGGEGGGDEYIYICAEPAHTTFGRQGYIPAIDKK